MLKPDPDTVTLFARAGLPLVGDMLSTLATNVKLAADAACGYCITADTNRTEVPVLWLLALVPYFPRATPRSSNPVAPVAPRLEMLENVQISSPICIKRVSVRGEAFETRIVVAADDTSASSVAFSETLYRSTNAGAACARLGDCAAAYKEPHEKFPAGVLHVIESPVDHTYAEIRIPSEPRANRQKYESSELNPVPLTTTLVPPLAVPTVGSTVPVHASKYVIFILLLYPATFGR
jgi:hypothetical protein